jgi:hypothetical protein
VAREPRFGELEEARAVRVERLGRDRRDRRLQMLVEDAPAHVELRLGVGELALELGAAPEAVGPLAQCRTE